MPPQSPNADPASNAVKNALPGKPVRMGVTVASYGIRWGTDHPARFKDSLDMLRHCQTLGAGGIQVGIAGWTPPLIQRMRPILEESGMFLEGQVGLPRSEADSARFEAQIALAKEGGARVFRAVMLSGRRYENFDTRESFDAFARRSWDSLVLAERVARKQDVRLAIENHKDWRADELLDILRRISSEHVRVCVDIGNSISLLEDPMDIVEAYAPWAITSHFKDMALETYADGFLLSEVPLGAGFLDLPKVVAVLRRANPDIQFNLEMITRDPLKVPCLTDKYWATLETLPARQLARTLDLVKRHPPRHPLPRVSGRDTGDRIAFEEANNAACFNHARAALGFV